MKRERTLEGQLFLAGIFLPFLIAGLWLLGGHLLPRLPFPFRGCLWDRFLGIYCFGCGGTRAVYALLHGRFLKALWYHPLVPYGAVLYCLFMGSHLLSLLSGGRIRGLKFRSWYLYAALVILVANCLLKNFLRLAWGITLD